MRLLTFSGRLRAMATREKRNATTSRGGGGGGTEATMSVDLANFPGCGEGLEQAARFCNNGGLVVRNLSQRHLLRRDGVPSPYPGKFDYIGRLGPWRSCFHSHLDHGAPLRLRARARENGDLLRLQLHIRFVPLFLKSPICLSLKFLTTAFGDFLNCVISFRLLWCSWILDHKKHL